MKGQHKKNADVTRSNPVALPQSLDLGGSMTSIAKFVLVHTPLDKATPSTLQNEHTTDPFQILTKQISQEISKPLNFQCHHHVRSVMHTDAMPQSHQYATTATAHPVAIVVEVDSHAIPVEY